MPASVPDLHMFTITAQRPACTIMCRGLFCMTKNPVLSGSPNTKTGLFFFVVIFFIHMVWGGARM